jgi:hypothetical protein
MAVVSVVVIVMIVMAMVVIVMPMSVVMVPVVMVPMIMVIVVVMAALMTAAPDDDPAVPTRVAAPAQSIAPGVTAPIPAGPGPAFVVPAILAPLPIEELGLLNEVAQSIFRAKDCIRRDNDRTRTAGGKADNGGCRCQTDQTLAHAFPRMSCSRYLPRSSLHY